MFADVLGASSTARFRLTLMLLLTAALTACGGGGGSSQLTVAPRNVAFSAERTDGAPSAVTLRAEISNIKNNIYIGVFYTGTSLETVEYAIFDTYGEIYVRPRSPSELAAGIHHDTITIVACSDPECNRHIGGSPVNVPVTYEVIERFDVASDSLTFSATLGDESAYPANMWLEVRGNGENWAATTDAAWLSLDSTTGSAPGFIEIAVSPSGLAEGSYTSTVTVTEDATGQTFTVPVALDVSGAVLNPSDAGIAFVSLPGASRLTQTITIGLEGKQDPIGWTASSNQAWLSVSPNGSTGGQLTLTADPTELATNTLYRATVTVASDDVSVIGNATVEVGLWVADAAPNDMDVLRIDRSQIATDPIRPYVYAINGTAVEVYHIYTAALVKTFNNVGSNLDGIVASHDGRALYAVDVDNQQIVSVDLDTGAVEPVFALQDQLAPLHVAYGRPGGRPVLLAAGSYYVTDVFAYDLTDRFVYQDTYNQSGPISTNSQGNVLCVTGFSCSDMRWSRGQGRARIDFTSAGTTGGAGSNNADVTLSPDGRLAYTASGWPYLFYVHDLALGTRTERGAGAYPNNAEVTDDGLFVGGTSALYGPTDVWVYSEDGTQLAINYVSGYARELKDRQLKVSGDGRRAIGLTTDPRMVFLSLP